MTTNRRILFLFAFIGLLNLGKAFRHEQYMKESLLRASVCEKLALKRASFSQTQKKKWIFEF